MEVTTPDAIPSRPLRRAPLARARRLLRGGLRGARLRRDDAHPRTARWRRPRDVPPPRGARCERPRGRDLARRGVPRARAAASVEAEGSGWRALCRRLVELPAVERMGCSPCRSPDWASSRTRRRGSTSRRGRRSRRQSSSRTAVPAPTRRRARTRRSRSAAAALRWRAVLGAAPRARVVASEVAYFEAAIEEDPSRAPRRRRTTVSRRVDRAVHHRLPAEGKQPGWDVESVGWHGDDGCVFHGHGTKAPPVRRPLRQRRRRRLRRPRRVHLLHTQRRVGGLRLPRVRQPPTPEWAGARPRGRCSTPSSGSTPPPTASDSTSVARPSPSTPTRRPPLSRGVRPPRRRRRTRAPRAR